MEQVLSVIIGIVAQFFFKFLQNIGLSGTPMLWIVYGVSVAVSVGIHFFTGDVQWSNIAASAGLIVATAQTVYQLFMKDATPPPTS